MKEEYVKSEILEKEIKDIEYHFNNVYEHIRLITEESKVNSEIHSQLFALYESITEVISFNNKTLKAMLDLQKSMNIKLDQFLENNTNH